MDNLIKIIKLRGYKVADFARKILGQEYRTFKTQVDKKTMRYKDIKIVLKVLGINFEDLEGKFEPEAEKPRKEVKQEKGGYKIIK